MNDLIIIGGGPAALAAAIYAIGKQLNILVIADELGGKAGWRQHIVGQLEEEYLAGEEAVRAFEGRITQAGCVLHDRVHNVTKTGDTFQVTTAHNGNLEATAVLVTTGATPIELAVPGSREFLGQGLGYSITTHAHLFAGKTSAVIGNTLRALRGATELAQTARQLYLIVPDPSILAAPLAHAAQQSPNVEILAGAQVIEISGGMNVEEVVVKQGGETRRLAVDAAFVDLGLRANSGMVREILDLEPGRFISVDERNATAVPGLFAAGDVTTDFGEQTLIAIGEGARAAIGAYDYVLAHKALHQYTH